jgi:hypothetical protein
MEEKMHLPLADQLYRVHVTANQCHLSSREILNQFGLAPTGTALVTVTGRDTLAMWTSTPEIARRGRWVAIPWALLLWRMFGKSCGIRTLGLMWTLLESRRTLPQLGPALKELASGFRLDRFAAHLDEGWTKWQQLEQGCPLQAVDELGHELRRARKQKWFESPKLKIIERS